MSFPTDGYVTDIPYTSGYYRELAPALHRFALLLGGIRPPDIGAGFRYAELGSGHTVSTLIHAASMPSASFHALDLNAGMIDGANARAAAAGITNLHLHVGRFEDAIAWDTEPFDAVALHGVWSWVSAENRLSLVEFLRRHLRPGGYVYLGYNCQPGWSALMPLREILVRTRPGGDTSERIAEGLQFAERLRRAGAGYFVQNPAAGQLLQALADKPDPYIAHEYMNRDWAPMYHQDVAGALAQAGLEFAAPMDLPDAIPGATLAPDQQQLLDDVAPGPWRETVRDLLLGRPFRRDLFVRSGERLTAGEQRAQLAATMVARVAAGTAPDQGQPEDVLLGLLAAGPNSIGALHAVLHGMRATGGVEPGDTWQQTLDVVTRAIASLQVAPISGNGVSGQAMATEPLNRLLLEELIQDGPVDVLASPVTGGGVALSRTDRLFLLALRQGETDPVAFAWRHLQKLGRKLQRDGERLQSEQENVSELQRLSLLFQAGTVPMLRSLGIVTGVGRMAA